MYVFVNAFHYYNSSCDDQKVTDPVQENSTFPMANNCTMSSVTGATEFTCIDCYPLRETREITWKELANTTANKQLPIIPGTPYLDQLLPTRTWGVEMYRLLQHILLLEQHGGKITPPTTASYTCIHDISTLTSPWNIISSSMQLFYPPSKKTCKTKIQHCRLI